MQMASPTQRVMAPLAMNTSQSCCRWPTLLWGTSSAVRTASTPGMARASEASMFRILARGYWERMAEPWTMPSISTSSQYSPVPSTFSRTSVRKARSPTW